MNVWINIFKISQDISPSGLFLDDSSVLTCCTEYCTILLPILVLIFDLIKELLDALSELSLNVVYNISFLECHFVIVFNLFNVYSLFLSFGGGQPNLLQSMKFIAFSDFLVEEELGSAEIVDPTSSS